MNEWLISASWSFCFVNKFVCTCAQFLEEKNVGLFINNIFTADMVQCAQEGAWTHSAFIFVNHYMNFTDIYHKINSHKLDNHQFQDF